MLMVTEAAKQKLKETLLNNTDDQTAGLRLKKKSSGQFGLVLDSQLPADDVIEHKGLKVLLVGQEIAELLQEVTLDVQDTPDGPRLAIFQG